MTLAGCHLCSKCCELDGPSHDCPDCGSRVQGTGFSPCFSCSIKRGNVKRQQSAQHMLVTQQAKQLYADFTQWGNSSQRASKLAAHASRYLQFITRIDIALQQASVPLDQAVLLETFTTQELRQMGLLMQFLVEQGAFLQDAAARRQNSDEALVQSKLKGATGKPWAADLQAFDTALAQRQKPLNVRSRKSYLSAAIALLTAAKVGRATQLKQEAVDALLRSKPGLRASLTPYLSHLASRHGMRLKVPGKRTAPRQSLRSEEHTSELQSPCNLVCRLLLEKKKTLTLHVPDHLRPDLVPGKCHILRITREDSLPDSQPVSVSSVTVLNRQGGSSDIPCS